MVSGFLNSPKDQDRIFSGEASPMLMASKSSTWACCFNKSSRSFKDAPPHEQWNAGRPPLRSFLLQVNVDGERAHFLQQHVEGLRHAGLDAMVAVDDVLVHLGAAGHVVGLDR